MKANSDKSKQSKKATRRVLAGVLCGASVLSLVLSLVMPPISQAIANDAQAVSAEDAVADENTLDEEAGAGNSTGKDAENRNSDETEGDETSGDAAAVDLSSDDAGAKSAEQPTDDGADGENDVMPTAADGFTELNQSNIHNQFGNGGTPGNYRLTGDLEYADTITLDHGETVIDLNGHKITHTSDNQSLFNITGGATLTVMDSQQATVDDPIANNFECSDSTLSKNANLASVVYKTPKIPDKLIYYVTGSSVNVDGTSTTEALYRHEVTIGGAIVACSSSNRVNLINLYGTNGKGGTFNLQSGVLTTTQDANVGHLIYAENRSNVNMSGGYVCGASMGSSGAGAGIHVNGSTLEISDGVIAGNFAPSGGGVYAKDSAVDIVGGIISGNGTNNYESGYGAGICAENSRVTITNGYITNNNYQFYKDWEGSTKHLGNGCHGGGGIAAFNGGNLTIVGGYITGNYSAEAGGGIYAGAWNRALSGFTFSGGIIASNVAQNSEGGGIRIAAPTVGEFNVSGKKAYITNNTTNTTNDWGGGGVFIQGGNSGENVDSASLKIYNALITNNSAQGYGGGFAACPSGKTAITDTNGIAIFGNTDADGKNLSGGTNGKKEDQLLNDDGGEITTNFKNNGHEDLFLIHKRNNGEYIAAVTGQMLGGGAANWTGTIDNTPTSIGKYEGAQVKYMIGLKSEPISADKDAAIDAAALFITGNSSNIHGGGIMTNGDVVAGSTTQVSVYPKMKLNGTKALTGLSLTAGEFKFQLLKQNKSGKGPYFDKDDKLQFNDDCSKVGDGVENDADGNFVFDLGRAYSAGTNVYYLVEDPSYNHVDGVDYDKTIYKIELTTTTETRPVLHIDYTYYLVTKVKVTNLKTNESNTITPPNGSDVSIKITDGNTVNTFTNAYAQGFWTPQVTKKVDGGEMKAFTLELANKDDESFSNPETVTINPSKATTDENGNKTVAVNFLRKKYELKDLINGSNYFTYYVREKEENSTYPHYTFDRSVYKITVYAEDNGSGEIKTSATYTKIKGADGNPVTDTPHELTDKSTPTFTNTYSTSLPLSGMSGVTLTYLAGLAVLCAAAAWMHIRRKANAKGGERRE